MQRIRDALFEHPRSFGVVALIVVAVAGVLVFKRPGGADPKRAGQPPVPVTAVHAARRDVPIFLQGLGTVQALNTVTLKARVDGILEAVQFAEGQNVKKGDVLARIDPRPYRAMLDQAKAKKAQDEAQLPAAMRDLARSEDLAKNNFAAEQTLERLRATVAQLKAAVQADAATVDRAQIDMDFTNITSPIDGRIGLRHVDVGNVVRASDNEGLAVISQIHPITVVFTLPADDLPDITKAMRGGRPLVAVRRYDTSEKLTEGALIAVDSTVDQSTGTIRLKASFDNADDALWPGEAVRAELLIRTDAQAIVVPEPAVQRGPDGFFVYVVKPDSSVAVQPVEIHDVGEGIVVVTRGLNTDDRVVTKGHSRLRPGARVKVSESADPPAEASPQVTEPKS